MKKPLLFALLLIGCATAPSPPSETPTRHTFLMAGNKAGFQLATVQADGRRVYDFEYNDRGRGPRTQTEITFGPGGTPTALHVSGVDYFKGPVDETFSIAGGVARWKNKAEEGSARVGSTAPFYVSMYGPPEEMAILARAALERPDNRLQLLPSGEASVKHIGSMTVEAGGATRLVHHYAVSGLGLAPIDLWLDEDRGFFASVSSWSSLIREGWETVADTLIKRQEELSATRAAELARRLAKKSPSGVIAITNANLFDSESEQTIPGTTILIRGNRIDSVGPDHTIAIPSEAMKIDAAGKTVMPGLWDMHVHTSESDGILHLAAGVTTARDLANDIEMIQSLRDKIDAGTVIGPRMILAGFMDGPGPYAGPTKILVSTEGDVRVAIDRYASLGYEQIKVYSSIKPELVPFIVSYAHSRGLRVSGHIPATMTAEQAVNLGFDEIQHVNMLFLNFFKDVQDTRTPARFTAVAERGAGLDLASAEVQSFVRLLRDKNIVVDPTVSIFEGMFTDRPGVMSVSFAPIADRLPPQVRRGFLTGGLPVPDGMDERYRASFEKMLQFVRLLYEAGVPIVAGTDSFAGFALHRELELYVKAGIPPTKVLQLATLGAARIMKRDADLGSVRPGKLADLLIISGDPAKNISDIRQVETVLMNGVIYSSQELYREVGVH